MVQEKLNLILLTGRTIDQGVGKESGKSTKLYFDSTTICYMDQIDMDRLGLKNNDHIKATTDEGSVILRAVKHPRGAMPGMIYIPYGPWANVICSSKTTSIGMPSFKGTPVAVRPALNQPVLTLKELLKKEFGK